MCGLVRALNMIPIWRQEYSRVTGKNTEKTQKKHNDSQTQLVGGKLQIPRTPAETSRMGNQTWVIS